MWRQKVIDVVLLKMPCAFKQQTLLIKKEKSNAKFIAAVTKHNAYQVCESAASTVPFLYPSSWLQSPIVRLDVGQQQDGPGMGVFGGRRTLCHTY